MFALAYVISASHKPHGCSLMVLYTCLLESVTIHTIQQPWDAPHLQQAYTTVPAPNPTNIFHLADHTGHAGGPKVPLENCTITGNALSCCLKGVGWLSTLHWVVPIVKATWYRWYTNWWWYMFFLLLSVSRTCTAPLDRLKIFFQVSNTFMTSVRV